MKYISYADYIAVGERIWQVNSKPSGIYTAILKRFVGQLEAMLSHHSRVLVVRVDLREYSKYPDNNRVSTFLARLIAHLKRHYDTKRIAYGWVRELEKAKQQHYHAFLVLDGHKVNRAHYINQKCREIWSFMDGSQYTPANCYYHFHRDDQLKQQAAIYRISYLAKGRGKGYRPEQTKDYAASRISMKSIGDQK
ncbi:inovirus-type Gp2 protein [Simiduia curdlanivorans]|uniref:Inovirus-type Gp2 protein n=1 Tax=Simiduia curdlanivorans TaxID=1492769 RepID=A0ABV8V8E3_9GAMM|nr:inovirus-type Gp2 protein [Simiduia curdlanivorans]MDN3638747.1 inovirus-type Gp2 protein [Simiduia curdlanivorans]